MSMRRPYGTWPSPLSAASISAHGTRVSSAAVSGGSAYWIEGRPAEGGRNVLVERSPEGTARDITPAGFNVRTRVHEYGGGAFVLEGRVVYFANFADQRLYVSDLDAPDSPPRPLTPEGPYCYADACVDGPRRRLICVREDHSVPGREAVTTLVAIALDDGRVDVLATGEDFYSTPRLSPDGRRLCWLSWRHPRMPWDGSELWTAAIRDDGSLGPAGRVAGGETESIYQPGWLADGRLVFASDRDGWWRLYVARPPFEGTALAAVLRKAPADTEFGRPQWLLGTACWAQAGDDRLVVSYTSKGRWSLGVVSLSAGTLTPIAPDLQPQDWLATTPASVVLVAGSAHAPAAVVELDLGSGTVSTLRAGTSAALDPLCISEPQAVEFPTTGGRTAHAFYYPPRHAEYIGLDGELPPLIVSGHGGPIAAADATFDRRIQFWTTRGFAVVDVNYGGSTGFGTEYRRRLNGQWGIVDVDDLINAARHLVATGRADPRRLAIRGGSAGGYTVLAAMTQQPEFFGAGASYYGISDLEALLHDSHKFESRCLDILVGPYPAARDEYIRRSPIHAVDRLACPLILFQGLEDKVVPPNQSEMMVEALKKKGRPVAYLAFEGEQHGFRRAENIVRSLEAELYFYGAVFGFNPADRIEPVEIANAAALPTRTVDGSW
jgi:dipeptidyl aminopeptidase/acylaminoacyl peptidase